MQQSVFGVANEAPMVSAIIAAIVKILVTSFCMTILLFIGLFLVVVGVWP